MRGNLVEANAERIPHALHWGPLRPGKRMARGGLFHPDHLHRVKPKQIASWRRQVTAGKGRGQEAALQATEKAGWVLVFTDEFDREELGENWKAVTGNWNVDGGTLRGSGVLISAHGFPQDDAGGYLRMEFEAVPDFELKMVGIPGTDGKALGATGRISDMSSVLHAADAADESGALSSGYFFQFGGRWNSMHQIARAGAALVADANPTVKIKSNRVQKILVENDNGRLSMFVDGKNVLTGREKTSLVGAGHDRVGFYFYTAARVLSVRVYVKPLQTGLE